MTLLSVIVCTHNPSTKHFARTLQALLGQTLAPDRWELLLIDNKSKTPLEGRTDLSWHPHSRIVREETLGLTPARLRGIAEAGGDLLVFVDDDNVLDSDYLKVAYDIGNERPWLGAWSGQCLGEFEESPPEWTRRYWGNLAIREFDKEVWSNLPRLPETMPLGAGMVVRREVARHYLTLNTTGRRAIQFDRTGESLISGGDNDLAACACALGLGVGLTPRLKLRHLIAPNRLSVDYLERLAEGISYSSVLLDFEWGILTPYRTWVGRLADWIRTLRLSQPHRRIAAAAYRGRNQAARELTLRQIGATKRC